MSGTQMLRAGGAAAESEATGGLVLGIDVGGTKTAAIAFDRHGRAVGHAAAPTPRRGLGETVIAVARDALGQVPDGVPALAGIGIATAGPAASAAGVIRTAGNLDV